MSTLGQWFFEKEKQSILQTVKGQSPYVAKVAGASSDFKTVNIIDPFTGATENELLTVIGPAPVANDYVMVLPLVDGERVAILLKGHSPTALGTLSEVSVNGVAVGFLAKALGNLSVALSYNTQALGDYSIAIGYNAVTDLPHSIAIGRLASAVLEGGVGVGYMATPGRLAVALGYQVAQGITTGELSVSIGYWATASAMHSVAIGRAASAGGLDSVAIGYLATNTGNYSVAIGRQASASGQDSIAMGRPSDASGTYGVAIGYASSATANYATALGYNADAIHASSVAIGENATSPGASQGHISVSRLHAWKGTSSSGLVLKSADGSQWMLTIGNTGVVSTVKL